MADEASAIGKTLAKRLSKKDLGRLAKQRYVDDGTGTVSINAIKDIYSKYDRSINGDS